MPSAHKKAGTKDGPGIVLAGCPDKTEKKFQSGKVSMLQDKTFTANQFETFEIFGPCLLRAPSRPQGQVPHLGQDARHLHPV